MPDGGTAGALTPEARRRWARVAGLGYLVIIGTGIFGEFFVRGSLVVPGDPAATAAGILAGESLYRLGLAAEVVMLLADVLLAAALYLIFESVSRSLALVAAFFRLAHGAVVGVNLLNAWGPLLLLGGGDATAAIPPEQLQARALILLETHAFGYAVGLAFFGVHCLALGLLVLRSGWARRILGVLLLVAGAGYLADTFARTLLVDYSAVEGVLIWLVFLPAFVAELSFALWLLASRVGTGKAASPGPR